MHTVFYNEKGESEVVSPEHPLPVKIDGDITIGTSVEINNDTGNPIPVSGIVIPSMTSGGNLSLTTNATGTTFNAFASQACKQLTISNQTDTLIEVRQGGAGVAFQIPTGSFYTFFGIANANELSVRRTDVSNTTVTLTARWEV